MDKEDSKIYAFLAALLSIVGVVIAVLAWRKDKYAMFYAAQSLVIFIAAVVVAILRPLLKLIPILGIIIIVVLTVIVALCWLISWIYALSGKEQYAWFLGKWSKGLKF